jgi:TatD DNase family protein
MTPLLPPLDLHAHVKPTIAPRELEQLGAVVFVATRSLDEFHQTEQRRDSVTVWGVGAHPGVERAQRDFDPGRFAEAIKSTAFVSEVGLDGRSKVPIALQEQTFRDILRELSAQPRIVSIHSNGASLKVLDALSEVPTRGAILHWWRGTAVQTARAIELGCWFSINLAGMKYPSDVALIPFHRILIETDHPSGDRGASEPRQPGAVGGVESALALVYGVTPAEIRTQVWKNFARLVDDTGVLGLLPAAVRRMTEAARK